MLIKTVLKNFILDCKARRLSQHTIQRYESDNQRLLDFLHSRRIRHIEHISHKHLRAFFAKLHEVKPKRIARHNESERYSPFTTEGIYRSIKRVFNWSVSEGHIKQNPMQRVRRPKTPKRIIKRLSEAQLKILLSEIAETKEPIRNLAIILLMVDSGLRKGEWMSLKLDNVHLDEQFICVNGKGEKERNVPIGQVTCEAIAQWLTIRPETRCKNVFVKSSGKPLSGEAIRAVLRRIQNKLKLQRLYQHLLRHTFSKLYLRRGTLEKLSQILGHADIQTTKEIYVQDFDIHDLIEEHSKASPIDRLNRRSKITRPAQT